MAELTTLARPYAKAAFEYAQAHQQLASWSAMLGLAAAVSQDGTLQRVLKAPRLTSTEKATTFIDVCGESKGKGFQGVMKKYNFQGGPASHGSHFHRRPGSIGCRATPARVFAGKKMPGQMGTETTTVQNLQVVELNTQDGYMLVKGSLPGGKNGFVKISKANKKA